MRPVGMTPLATVNSATAVPRTTKKAAGEPRILRHLDCRLSRSKRNQNASGNRRQQSRAINSRFCWGSCRAPERKGPQGQYLGFCWERQDEPRKGGTSKAAIHTIVWHRQSMV